MDADSDHRFVQKSGPIFTGQDALEAILRWDNPPRTTLVGIAYGFLCTFIPFQIRRLMHYSAGFYPFLLLVLPNLVLITILLSTYPSKNSRTKGTSIADDHFQSSDPVPPELVATVPTEGSVEYVLRLCSGKEGGLMRFCRIVIWLISFVSSPSRTVMSEYYAKVLIRFTKQQNIQIMMGRIADLSDLGLSLLPYLSWTPTHAPTTLVLLQLASLSTLLIALLHPLIPWRLLFFLIGESALLAGHPISISLLAGAMPTFGKAGRGVMRRFGRIMADDRLTDEEIDSTIIELEKFAVERFVEGGFGELRWVEGKDLFARTSSAATGAVGGAGAQGGEERMEEEGKSWRWIEGESWSVDFDGNWAGGIVDDGSSPPSSSPSQTHYAMQRLTSRHAK